MNPPPDKKRVFAGVGLSPSLAQGRLHARHPGEAEVPRYRVPKAQVAREAERFDSALAQVRADLDALRAHSRGMPGAAEIGAFIGLYRALLDDPEIAEKPRAAVLSRRCNAEWALKESADAIAENFRRIEDPYLRERGNDISYVVSRVLLAMKSRAPGAAPAPASGKGRILVARELSPAEVVEIVRAGYAGFVTESGGATSHTAILARGMGVAAAAIPEALTALPFGERALVDGARGEVVVHPSPGLLRAREAEIRAAQKPTVRHSRRRPQRARTLDGVEISLEANMEFPDEAESALAAGADGVGLFRTEFLFLNRKDLPGEDEQFEIYRDVVSRMSPLPVTFRTLDIGADKIPTAETGVGEEANPALGVRAIRQCLAAPEMFLTQLRALLRAAGAAESLRKKRPASAAAAAAQRTESGGGGGVRILLPMVSHPGEMAQAEILLGHAAEQLRAANRESARAAAGVMIEVPASVFIMRDLSRRASFFSIGTNDLIQYAMASDRGEEKLSKLHDPLHPAILHLLSGAIGNARRAGRPVTLCGEAAGEPRLTRLMLCLGLTRLSMNAAQIPAVRAEVERTDQSRLDPHARRILKAETPAAAAEILREINESD